MGIEGNGFKMLFGKQQRNFCSFRACFLTVGIMGINRVSHCWVLRTGKCFNACCILCHIMVKIHDQGPQYLQEKQYDKKEKKSLICLLYFCLCMAEILCGVLETTATQSN